MVELSHQSRIIKKNQVSRWSIQETKRNAIKKGIGIIIRLMQFKVTGLLDEGLWCGWNNDGDDDDAGDRDGRTSAMKAMVLQCQ